MKKSASKSNPAKAYQRAPAIHAPQLPRNFEQIRKRAQEICVARGGTAGMTLDDWLKAELELEQEFRKQAHGTNQQERNL